MNGPEQQGINQFGHCRQFEKGAGTTEMRNEKEMGSSARGSERKGEHVYDDRTGSLAASQTRWTR